VKQILEGKIQDDNDDWQKCYLDAIMANPGQYTGEDGEEKIAKVMGKCCVNLKEDPSCVAIAYMCQALADGDLEGIDANDRKLAETTCNGWCEEENEAWCSGEPAPPVDEPKASISAGAESQDSGEQDPDGASAASPMSTGAIIGTAVGAVVVVAVVGGLLVFFLVLKKKQEEDE
jgi:hypothetical protein